MANRTGTYFAFDGLGETDPLKSDFRYYATVQGWNAASHIDFKFVNSHDKASAVSDTSKRATLEASIRERLAASKNMVIILSGDTRKKGSMLSWEIEKAVDYYELPLIIAYTGTEIVQKPDAYSSRWPETLAARILAGTADAIHIPFKKDPMFDAINQFTVNTKKIGGSLKRYSDDAYRSWGLL
jgi:hypothetical protein